MTSVYTADLVALDVTALFLMEAKPWAQWLMILGMIFLLGLWGHRRAVLGSGDLPVLLAMALILDPEEFSVALLFAAVTALLWFLLKKKASTDALPFIPFLLLGAMMIYLIRLRLIFS